MFYGTGGVWCSWVEDLDDIYDKMRRRDQVNEMLLQKVDEIGKNQIIIMTHQGIASPNGVKTFERKKDWNKV